MESCVKLDLFEYKKLQAVIFFFHYFHCTPLHGLAVCGLTYSVCMFFLYLSHSLLGFNETCAFLFLMHTQQVQHFQAKATKLTLEGTLHSRVKDFTNDNSIVIFSLNSKGRLIC